MKTPLQILKDRLWEIGKVNQGLSGSLWPLDYSKDIFYRGRESATEAAIDALESLLLQEREVIEKSFMAGYLSDNVNGPVSGEEFYNKQFGNEHPAGNDKDK